MSVKFKEALEQLAQGESRNFVKSFSDRCQKNVVEIQGSNHFQTVSETVVEIQGSLRALAHLEQLAHSLSQFVKSSL